MSSFGLLILQSKDRIPSLISVNLNCVRESLDRRMGGWEDGRMGGYL